MNTCVQCHKEIEEFSVYVGTRPPIKSYICENPECPKVIAEIVVHQGIVLVNTGTPWSSIQRVEDLGGL